MQKKIVLLLAVFCLSLLVQARSSSPFSDVQNSDSPATVPPSQTRVPLASTGSTLTLDDVVREALANNPAVQSASHTVAAQRRKVPQAKAFPDPAVSVGWMGNATPFSVMTGDPSSYRSVSAMQTLPYPGKLRLKGEIAAKEAEASTADYEGVRRKVVAQAKAAFFEYFYYDKALQVSLRDKDLLHKLSQISEARYRVGKAMQQDVLKSQTEISLLLQKITVLQQQRAIALARLNTVMARSPESPLPPAADVTIAPLSRRLDDLYKVADSNNPALKREQRVVERNQLAVNLAQKEYRPDLSVAFMYQQRPDMPDMKGATFTVSIPVFYRSKQREGVRQAEEEVIAAQKNRDDSVNETRFELKQAYLAAQAAKDLADLYAKAVVPQSSLALESSMSAYQVGSNDFLTVVSNFSTLLNYETDYYRQVADYQMAMAQIESLVGVDLTSAQVEVKPQHSESGSPDSAASSVSATAQAVKK